MTNNLLTPDIILREALMQLENELVLAKLVNRDYEQQFAKPLKPGDTIRIRRPVKGQVRTGAVRQVQDVDEGNTSLTVATQIGADLDFNSVDMTLKVEDFSDRYLRPQMIQIANKIDLDLHAELYQHCPNWVGTPGNTVNSFSDYALAPQRLDEFSIPRGDWNGILSPADYWGTIGSITALSADAPVKSALQNSKLGRFANTDTYMSQNVKAHTVGTWGASPAINGGSQGSTYAAVKTSKYLSQTLNVDGLTANTGTVSVGDVFTIDNVYAVNSVTGDALDFLKQFVVISAATADGSGAAALTISPAIITSGPYKTCSAVPADDAAITVKGTKGSSYRQNLVFQKDAVTLAVPPLVKPRGAVAVSSQTYKGITMRLIEGYDLNNDVSGWRFDVLYGVAATQSHFATRLSGSA
ncbi:MAG: hypothetical protein JSR91_00240 [Proteobacteria bacterium]|nr:hypothetical protein [Pseudomonadota bacterium]